MYSFTADHVLATDSAPPDGKDDFSQSPKVSARRIRELAEGDYIDHARPVLFLGDAGTGKTHLATALCVAACQQRRRVRFTTASRLVNELVEAREEHELSRVIRRYARYELLCIDELGYVPLADVGAELLFQVVSERCERAALVITTNLPFSEWTQVFTNVRLCKALLDRVTDQAHILETGTESYRFRRTQDTTSFRRTHCEVTPRGKTRKKAGEGDNAQVESPLRHQEVNPPI